MTQLNPAQQEVVDRGLLTSGFSVGLQMPTGAGKTWLAEYAIGTVLCSGQRAIYLTPLRALANELVERWRHTFDGFDVGVFTGEHGQRQPYPVPFDRARLLIMTPERLDACTRHWRSHWSWLPEVGLLVVDELHLLGEPRRGPRLEGALLRAQRLNPFMQVLGLSATLSNRSELAEWLGGVEFGSSWRPIPIEWRTVRYRKATDKPRVLIDEVRRCVDEGGQSLVFVQSRRRAETLAVELRGSGVSAGHHHAGLEAQERRQLEEVYRTGTLRALVSTGTLEMGFNLPARQVVLYDLQCFDGQEFIPLSVNTVWQRAGRAGRRGLDTKGEVVLVAPTWDRNPDHYSRGQFERIASGLGESGALAEQILAEITAGLARTRAQLARNMDLSLAAYQRSLPELDRVVGAMLEGGMLVEVLEESARGATLKPTRLGRIAVRQMLAPSTVVGLSRGLLDDTCQPLTFFDVLLLCVATDDCEPLIPADFEELEQLGAMLAKERSTLLEGGRDTIASRVGAEAKRLLTVIKTALVVRAWTRDGDAARVADDFGCYAFEVRRLTESMERILAAAVAVLSPPKEEEGADEFGPLADEGPSLAERVRALYAMVANGIDESVVTLTFISGIGGTLARRLRNAGIMDIDELALAEPSEVAKIRGVALARAERWVAEATEKIGMRSAFALRETGDITRLSTKEWTFPVDPYRLRRALDLHVQRRGENFTVSGGLEPHRVSRGPSGALCDCADFAKGRECKHVLAVRIHCDDSDILPLITKLSVSPMTGALDLFQLWFDGGNGR